MARRAEAPVPAPNKEGFARLIGEQCVRLGYVDARGEPDVRALAAACGLTPTTLYLAIKRPTRPSTDTLLALERGTGVAVGAWLAALGLSAHEEIDEGMLSPDERELLTLARQRGDRWIRSTVQWLRSTAGAGDEGAARPVDSAR